MQADVAVISNRGLFEVHVHGIVTKNIGCCYKWERSFMLLGICLCLEVTMLISP